MPDDEAPPIRDFTELELATEHQLFAEIAKRNTHTMVVSIKEARGKTDCGELIIRYNTTRKRAILLAGMATVRLTR